MTMDAFVQLVDGAKQTPRGWQARCPAHDDRSPSLSVREGDRGILLKCWAGCSAEDITRTLRLRLSDLFFDSGEPDSSERQGAIQQRDMEQRERARAFRDRGALADAARKAERLIAAAKNVSIDYWSDAFLDISLNRLADAYELIGDCNGGE